MKNLPLLLLLLCCCADISAQEGSLINEPAATDTLSYALSQGTFKGLLRYSGQYRDSNLHVLQDSSSSHPGDKKQQQYSAGGGYLGYETAPIFNTSVGATLYTSQPVGNNPDDRRGLGGLYEENGGQGSYTVFGEVFIQYEQAGQRLKVGRQEMPDYRFVSLSNVRMTPITHEGVIYENSLFKALQFNLAYITKMKERNADKFIDMARGARIKEFNGSKKLIRGDYNAADFVTNDYNGGKKEMAMAGVLYSSDSISLEGWNYYINDFVNTLYLYGQYKLLPDNSDLAISLAAQYARQTDVGSHIAGNVNTWFYGLKAQAETRGVSLFFSYNEVAYNENSYDGGSIFVRWGTPQMFNSFQVQDSELAGTQSYATGIQYRFAHNSILPGIVLRLRYADYDMPDSLSDTDARQDRSETTFDINYAFSKSAALGDIPLDGLNLQLRIAYNNYETDYDFLQYKQIHGYEFSSVTDDFTDIRLYIDYLF